jgi:hypothetical protein
VIGVLPPSPEENKILNKPQGILYKCETTEWL